MGPHPSQSHLQLVGHQDDRLPPEHLKNALLEDVLLHVGIHGRQGVVQQVDLSVQVDGAGQADPLFLPPGEVEAPLPDLWTGSQRHCIWRVSIARCAQTSQVVRWTNGTPSGDTPRHLMIGHSWHLENSSHPGHLGPVVRLKGQGFESQSRAHT